MSSSHREGVFERADEAARFLRSRVVGASPAVGVILGSGLGGFVDSIAEPVVLPYREVPHVPTPSVSGHAGNVVVGKVGGTPTIAFQGRFHYYEGHDLDVVTFPVRVLQALGVRTLVLTAAVGGIRPGLAAGDLVALRDHLNLLGNNPLRGPNDDRLGTRFPDQTEVYSARLRQVAGEEARRLGFELQEGVYACVPGPCYETPAEVRMLAVLGAEVVGMSTVPEAIVARHAGIDVLALAVVANLAAGITPEPLSHHDVLEAGRLAAPRVCALLEAILGRLAEE